MILYLTGVVHRDLKPQNILLKFKEQHYQKIKLADFSFASRVHTPRSLTTRCGTPTYVAPEILKNIPYDQSADMWSVGVILYTLLVGYPPFASEHQSTLFQKIRTADYTFVEYDWRNISPSAQDLIRNLLTVDPSKRLTAKQALYESEWLRDQDVKRLSSSDLSSSVQQLRATRRYSLKSIAKMMIWGNTSSSSSRSMHSGEEEDEDQSEKKSE
jgi:serine/threonine protein kinase